MGSIIVDVKIRGSRVVALKALVDTGFYGDLITLPVYAEAAGIECKHERSRRLPDGRIARVRFGGGEIQVMDSITYGDVEVWEELRLPDGVNALLGVTALEKLGYRINPRTRELEKIELYLL